MMRDLNPSDSVTVFRGLIAARISRSGLASAGQLLLALWPDELQLVLPKPQGKVPF